ncbi:MAG: serine hydrolase domain-containing protein, partial [Gemmatimonadales bacterium]
MRAWHRPLAASLVLAVAVLHGAARAQDLTRANRQAVERFAGQLESDVQQDGIGGITAGVVMGDRLVWAKGFGWADPVKGVPAQAETIYRTGSISKSFTAVLLMKLVERGVLALDDPVERYVPEIAGLAELPDDAPAITFRHLASHTAGLIREPLLANAAVGPIERWEEKILASIPNTAYQAPPGEEYSYSNIGFGILGLAVSRAAGKPFMDLMREMVFDPLEMSSSFFVLTPAFSERMSVGHANWGEAGEGAVNTELPEREHDGRGYKVPNGGIYSTVRDLGR